MRWMFLAAHRHVLAIASQFARTPTVNAYSLVGYSLIEPLLYVAFLCTLLIITNLNGVTTTYPALSDYNGRYTQFRNTYPAEPGYSVETQFGPSSRQNPNGNGLCSNEDARRGGSIQQALLFGLQLGRLYGMAFSMDKLLAGNVSQTNYIDDTALPAGQCARCDIAEWKLRGKVDLLGMWMRLHDTRPSKEVDYTLDLEVMAHNDGDNYRNTFSFQLLDHGNPPLCDSKDLLRHGVAFHSFEVPGDGLPTTCAWSDGVIWATADEICKPIQLSATQVALAKAAGFKDFAFLEGISSFFVDVQAIASLGRGMPDCLFLQGDDCKLSRMDIYVLILFDKDSWILHEIVSGDVRTLPRDPFDVDQVGTGLIVFELCLAAYLVWYYLSVYRFRIAAVVRKTYTELRINTFSRASFVAKFPLHVLEFLMTKIWFWCDTIGLALFIMVIIKTVTFYVEHAEIKDLLKHYPKYPYRVANYTNPFTQACRTNSTAGGAPGWVPKDGFEGETCCPHHGACHPGVDSSQFTRVDGNVVDTFLAAEEALGSYTLYAAVHLFLCFFRVLTFAEVDERFAVISRMLEKSFVDILYFLCVFFTVLLGFVMSAHVAFGFIGLPGFQTFHQSFNTCFAIITNMSDDLLSSFQDESGLKGAHAVFFYAWYYSFYIFVVAVMFNLLLAIVLDGYAAAKDVPTESRRTIIGAIRVFEAQLKLSGSRSTSNIGVVRVFVVAARELDNLESVRNGVSDPFAVVRLGSMSWRTSTKPNTLNPRWREGCEFLVNDASISLHFSIWDDLDGPDDDGVHLMATKDVPLQHVLRMQGKIDTWLPLLDQDGHLSSRMKMRVRVSFHVEPRNDRAPNTYRSYSDLLEPSDTFQQHGSDVVSSANDDSVVKANLAPVISGGDGVDDLGPTMSTSPVAMSKDDGSVNVRLTALEQVLAEQSRQLSLVLAKLGTDDKGAEKKTE